MCRVSHLHRLLLLLLSALSKLLLSPLLINAHQGEKLLASREVDEMI